MFFDLWKSIHQNGSIGSNYKEVDKESDLSESSDLDSGKVNPEIDDESKYNDEGDDDENIVSGIYP